MQQVTPWKHGRPWKNRPAVIIGGGPSLTKEQVSACSRMFAIAINNSYKLAPWADILYFCDLRWWGWHQDDPDFKAFKGLRVTRENERLCAQFDIKMLRDTGVDGLDETEGCVRSGMNGGYQSLNLAINLGANPIILLGYDMRYRDGRTHWHNGHPVSQVPSENVYPALMRPAFENGMAHRCSELGVEVINCSPGSALRAFPCRDLGEVLREKSLLPDKVAAAL